MLWSVLPFTMFSNLILCNRKRKDNLLSSLSVRRRLFLVRSPCVGLGLTCSPSLLLLRPPGLSTALASELWSEVSGRRAMMPPSGGVAQTGTGHSYQTYQDFSYEEGGQAGGGGRMAAGGGDPMPKLTTYPPLRSTCNSRATAFMLSLHKAQLMSSISLHPNRFS